MKLWKSAVNGVVPATARSTWASPSTSRRTVIPCALCSASSMPASCGSCRTGPGTNTTGATDLASRLGHPRPLPGDSLAELEWHVRVRVERVGEGDPVVAVRDIPLRYENRGKLLAGQHLLQVFQHSRVRQRQRLAAGGPQDVRSSHPALALLCRIRRSDRRARLARAGCRLRTRPGPAW